MLVASRLAGSRAALLSRTSKHVTQFSRAASVRGFWPEPITQPTLDQFLRDINYFGEPKEFINIGLKTNSNDTHHQEQHDDRDKKLSPANNRETINRDPDVDAVLTIIGAEAQPPELDLVDTLVDRNQLVRLALEHGIYRDLFNQFTGPPDDIYFTPEQADRLYKLVPPYWITDQPYARVNRHPKKVNPIQYFEPAFHISAKFANSAGNDELHYNTSYYGNIIPACEAQNKPSISIDVGSNDLTRPIRALREEEIVNWDPGSVSLVNQTGSEDKRNFSLLLLNLDSLHTNHANLHWMITNISQDKEGQEARYDQVCDYLPVHGIRGYGYSRYVFLLLMHDTPFDVNAMRIDNFKLDSRKFDLSTFLEQNKSHGILPVGLSWFQTTWDESSNIVFHRFMNSRAPVYEHVQMKLAKVDFLDKAYPGKVPFNIFMDHHRDQKESNERVLLERLKEVDPFDYKDQYVKPKVPLTVFEDDEGPSWMKVVSIKKKNKIGIWRGLRPASATLPLNNNADLDKPIRPFAPSSKSLPGFPNLYPTPRKKLLKNIWTGKPASEHTNVYVDELAQNLVEPLKKMMNEYSPKPKAKDK